MPKVLLDSTTYIDLEKAPSHRDLPWAFNSVRHIIDYRSKEGNPFLSVVSVVEILRGLHRDDDATKVTGFRQRVPRNFAFLDVTTEIGYLAGEVVGKLERAGRTIGVSDSIIAATAIHEGLILVTSNDRHFQRVTDLGFPLILENWRQQ